MLDLDTRTRQKAARLPDGEAILALLCSTRVRKGLIRSAEDGEIAVATVAPELVASFPAAMASLQARQLVGLAVKLVLGDAGYVVANPKRRFAGAPPFQFGATFRRGDTPAEPGLVERLVASLTDAEAQAAHRLLSKRLGIS